MKGKGKGNYQDTLDSLTKLKIIHRLTVKPYVFEVLWNETRIHRNRLRKILDNFIESKMVITHRLELADISVIGEKNIKPMPGLIYHIMDIDNRESLKFLRDIRLDTFVKDLLKLNLLYPHLHSGRRRKMNIWERKYNYREYSRITYMNKVTEQLKIVRRMDYLFSPLLYLSQLQKEDYSAACEKYSYFTRLRLHDPEEYSRAMREFDITFKIRGNNIIDYNKNYPFTSTKEEVKDELIKKIITECKTIGLSKYYALILLSHNFPSRENYFKVWNMIENC